MHNDKIQGFVTEFEKYLMDSFAELADEIGFSFIIRNSFKKYPWLVGKEDYEWKGYCGEKTDTNWLNKISGMLNMEQLDSEKKINAKIAEAVKQEEVLFFCLENGKKDSEINSRICGGKKDIIWLVTGRRKGEKIWFLLEEAIEKTKEQLNDLIFLSYWEDIEETLFHAVKSKEEIRERYIERICSNAGIRDRELISLISARKYEKRETYSRIYFGEVPEKGIELSFDGKDFDMWKFLKGNLRFIRKMLEMAKGNKVLIVRNTDGYQVMQGIASMEPEKGKQIVFGGYLKWTLMDQGKEVLRYEEGNYHLMSEEKTEEYKKLEDLQLENEEDIKNIIESLKKQAHGTSVVFLDGEALESELKRLEKNRRICRIRPVSIMNAAKAERERLEELIVCISEIDGALIADYKGNIHAIGAILDGESVIEADLSRGARYNSLKNYINWLVKKKKYNRDQSFAIVLSEDGGVDIEVSGI